MLRIQNHNMTVLPPAIESATAMKKMEGRMGPGRAPEENGGVYAIARKLSADFNKLRRCLSRLQRPIICNVACIA